MDLIERNHCVISGEEDLELLHSFKKFPVFMGCVEHPAEDDLRVDMNWWISRKTGSVQLNPLLPLDVLYQASHGSGSVGKLWEKHHEEFSVFLSRFEMDKIFEVGAGHGNLAKAYLDDHSDVSWTIVDPNPAKLSDDRINVVRGYFDEKILHDIRVNAVIHSHLIEHIYEPIEFIRVVKKVLPVGGMHCFSVPRMEVMLQKKYTNCLNFEHTNLLTEAGLEYMLLENGFELVGKQYFMDDHSIFYATRKTKHEAEGASWPGEYNKNKHNYLEYIRHHKDLIEDVNRKINDHDGKVYLFGGHIFSQYLIAFGLNVEAIECILDNDKNKQGKRLYGTDLNVKSPRILEGESGASVILRAGVFNEEIKEDIINNINKNVVFWE